MRAAGLRFENLNAAAMRVDELGDDREADSGALDVAALRRFSLVERLEDSIALFRGYPWTAIHHIEYELLPLGARMQRNGPAARRELDRIGEQIVENQAHLAAVGQGHEIFHLHVEPYALRHQGELLVLEHALDQRAQLEFGNLQAD